MKVLMTLVLVLLVVGCAAGEGGAGSTIAEETTSYNAREETTLNEGVVFIRPPHSTLSYGRQEVRGKLGSYCWSYRGTGQCVDATAMAVSAVSAKLEALTVPSGSKIVFRYGGQRSPDTVKASAYMLNKKGGSGRSLKVQGSGIERTIRAELPPGEYYVDVFLTAPQGDASYSFRIVVE